MLPVGVEPGGKVTVPVPVFGISRDVLDPSLPFKPMNRQIPGTGEQIAGHVGDIAGRV